MPHLRFTLRHLFLGLRRFVRNDHLLLALLAVVVGCVGGGAVVVFREAISFFQTLYFGSGTERFYAHAKDLPWWHLVAGPMLGGLAVGVVLHHVMPGRRPRGVADVIEANALHGGRMSLAEGLGAALVSAMSIGAGASVGREGPAVHLGASLGGWIAWRLHLPRPLSRSILGCGVAAAVAASFNAPIAGALFAAEVVIGHYAIKTFGPVVIASVTGTAVSRAVYGDYPAFIISDHPISSLWEFPAFLGLGVAAALAAILLLRAVELVDRGSQALPVPTWLRPAVGGLLVGLLAIPVPQVLGIGYGVTEGALTGSFPFLVLVMVGIAKLTATAISLGFGFGGGVFSPSLVIGAMLGGAYGAVATSIFPELSSGPGAYTIVGMGAMAAAVLGAPISTALIVFEMTADYALTMALLVAVVVGSVVTRQLAEPSFFAWQLKRRGVDLDADFADLLMREIPVSSVMTREIELVNPDVGLPELREMLQKSDSGEIFVVRDDGRLFGTITLTEMREAAFIPDMDALIEAGDVARTEPPVLTAQDDLKMALDLMRETGEHHLAVVEDRETMAFIGCLHERDALAAQSRALVQARREERGF